MELVNKNKRHGSIAAFVASGAVAVLSAGFLGTGALLLWADSEGDRTGYLTTSTERFESRGHAIATENLDLELDGPERLLDGGTLGKVRIRAESSDGKPVFVGIGRTQDVEDYLRGTRHDVVTDVDFDPFTADHGTRRGERKPEPPTEQRFWAASDTGTGERALHWDFDDGDWSVVVMNADGSAGVDAGISAGVKLSWLDEAGIYTLSTGFVLLILAGGIGVIGVRARRRAATQDAIAA